MAELDPRGVAATGPVKGCRQRNSRRAGGLGATDDVGGPLQQRGNRDIAVGGDRDEGRVGAVLQQAADQIGQQVAVAAHRRIGAAGEARRVLQQGLVEGVAHAVQALELEACGVAGAFQDGGHRQGVVGRKLRVDPRPRGEQTLGAGHIVEVGHRLAGEHRIGVEPALLGALHLRVPVGALDEADHQGAVERLRQRDDPVDDLGCALLVGLDRQAEAAPAGERRVGQHGRQHVERQLEPVGLLGVDGEVQVVAARLAGQPNHHRHQLGHHAVARQRVVARMQRR